jgi:hypothetical protein
VTRKNKNKNKEKGKKEKEFRDFVLRGTINV